MRLRLSKGDVAFIVLVGVALVGLLFGLGLPPFGTSQPHPQPPATPTPTNNPIVRENALPGTSDWQIPKGQGASTQIQAYANATSVLPGQKLTFYVSTQMEGTGYSIGFYRLGWYGGLGGRLIALQANQIGHEQGYYDPTTYHLIGCTACHVDIQTGLVEANWQPSYTLTVPSDWTMGVYLAKIVDANGIQTYVPFDVQGNLHSLYVAVTSDTTYAAYNDWGGYSLYRAYDGQDWYYSWSIYFPSSPTKFGVTNSMIHRWRQEFQAKAADIFVDKRNPKQKAQAQGYAPGESPDDLKRSLASSLCRTKS